MSRDNMWSHLQWYVIHTNPKQEDRAEGNLRTWQVEAFNPKIRTCRRNEFTGAPIYTVKPLFPRYIFARFRVGELFHKVRFTRGVHDVVSFGDHPTAVPDDMIAIIKSRIGDDGLVRIGGDFHPGERVVVSDGPLKSFTGIFEQEIKANERVRILLESVSYQVHVVVNKELIKKIG